MKDRKVLIVGNGTSRKGFPIQDVAEFYPVYACNAFYRTWYPMHDLPDYLVAVDNEISAEIDASNFPKDRFIHPPYLEQFEPEEYANGGPRYRMNAGMVAMQAAIDREFKGIRSVGCDVLYCIGFDFLLIDGWNTNVYTGSNGYGPTTRSTETDCVNRTKFLDWFCKKNSDTMFVFAFPTDIEFDNLRSLDLDNVAYTSLENLKKRLTKIN